VAQFVTELGHSYGATGQALKEFQKLKYSNEKQHKVPMR
jgi:hypothetical protein